MTDATSEVVDPSVDPFSPAIVGVGMIPRGEVGIVVASIGAAEGMVDAELFAVVVAMSILTTLAAPFVLRRLSRGSLEPDTG